MKTVQITYILTDELGLSSVTIEYNDTGLESDSKLIENIAKATVEALRMNNEDVQLQDILNENNISTKK